MQFQSRSVRSDASGGANAMSRLSPRNEFATRPCSRPSHCACIPSGDARRILGRLLGVSFTLPSSRGAASVVLESKHAQQDREVDRMNASSMGRGRCCGRERCQAWERYR
jgi:hypothetical protein